MKRALVMALAAYMLGVVALSTAGQALAKGSYTFNFDQTTSPWKAAGFGSASGYSVYLMTGEDGCSIQDNLRPGSFAALDSTGGVGYGPGTAPDISPLPIGTWLVASFPAAKYPNEVTVDWEQKSVRDCDGCSPIIYVGASKPTSMNQFVVLGDNDILKDKWTSHHFDSVAQVNDEGMVYVALGWAGTDAVVGLDCINIVIHPLDGGKDVSVQAKSIK